MTTPRFTTDNTEGYSEAELQQLNAAYESALLSKIDLASLSGFDIEDIRKCLEDAVAERVLAEYEHVR
jgi:hypothetical protein